MVRLRGPGSEPELTIVSLLGQNSIDQFISKNFGKIRLFRLEVILLHILKFKMIATVWILNFTRQTTLWDDALVLLLTCGSSFQLVLIACVVKPF